MENTNEKDIIMKWLVLCKKYQIKPWEWDFKNSLDEKINIKSDPIESIFNWYLRNGKITEAENTTLANAIYSVLWINNTGDLEKFLDKDIMNSFWGIYKHILKLEHNIKVNKWKDGKINKETFKFLLDRKYSFTSIDFNLLKKYALYTHTLGNFIIEPKGFNIGRKNGDYWDIALKQLKTYFDLIDESFWENHIKILFLQPFVNNDYSIASLWNPAHQNAKAIHPTSNSKNITTESLINEFLDHCCLSIEERGKQMFMELCKKLQIGEEYFPKHQFISASPQFANNLWNT